MGSVNKVLLIGNLGKDPEIRRTAEGKPVVNLSIATSESWRDKTSGERKDKTEWHRVTIWNEGLCKVAEQYLKKGSKVYLEGTLQTRKWTDKDGNEKYSTEVILQGFNGVLTMLDAPKSNGTDNDSPSEFGSAAPNSYAAATGKAAKKPAAGSPRGDMDDEIPFLMEWRG